MAKITLTERVAILETKMDTLTDRITEDIRQRRNGRLLKLREIGLWASAVTILLKLFGAI